MAARASQSPARPKRRLGKLADVATVLNCSVDTVDRYIRAGRLPVIVLPSGRRRVDLDELDRLIDGWRTASR
jgi:excisionase family DNA binding protein